MSRASAWILPALCLVPAAALAANGRVTSCAHAPILNFESGPVRALALSPDGALLYALNTADDRVDVYRTLGPGSADGMLPGSAGSRATPRQLEPVGDIFTGLEPVSMVAHPGDPDILFVANHVSDTVSVVSVGKRQVIATIDV